MLSAPSCSRRHSSGWQLRQGSSQACTPTKSMQWCSKAPGGLDRAPCPPLGSGRRRQVAALSRRWHLHGTPTYLQLWYGVAPEADALLGIQQRCLPQQRLRKALSVVNRVLLFG